MIADHLRYLWPQAGGLFVIGRIAFPLFCLAIACNVARSRAGSLFSAVNGRYLAWMLVFAVFSEVPYRWLDNSSQSLNVIPTLTLGLLMAWAVHHPQLSARLAGVAAALLGACFSDVLMYGLPGVLLPAACLIALTRGGVAWLLPAALAAAGNLTNSWLLEHLGHPFTWLVMATAALALLLGRWLLRCEGWRVAPVGRWGYWFYPLHLVAIKLLISLSAVVR